MTTTLTELLTPTRTCGHRAIDWQPCPAGCPVDGRLVVKTDRKHTAYCVTETYAAPGFAGRAFKVRKADGTTYDCLLADDRGHSTCTCPGCTYGAAEKADRRHATRFETLGCNHLDALATLVDAGALPESRTNAEADAGATEVEDQPLPSCFDGVACSRESCPF